MQQLFSLEIETHKTMETWKTSPLVRRVSVFLLPRVRSDFREDVWISEDVRTTLPSNLPGRGSVSRDEAARLATNKNCLGAKDHTSGDGSSTLGEDRLSSGGGEIWATSGVQVSFVSFTPAAAPEWFSCCLRLRRHWFFSPY